MRRGTTTMKMISSTSTTSTSGVTFISDCSSTSGPPWICMISVPLRLLAGALGDQPQTVESGSLDRDHGLPDVAEAKPRVAPDHDLALGLCFRRGAETFAEMLGWN